jgi:hypothetical protein
MVRSISVHTDYGMPEPRQGCAEEGRPARLMAIISLTNAASVITVNTFSYWFDERRSIFDDENDSSTHRRDR